ncbi:MAG: DUF4880 domain-containing protein [Pseudomonadota bacterium]
MANSVTHEPSESVIQEAVSWLVRLQSGALSESEHQDFLRWRAADPSHGIAWRRLEAIDSDIGDIASVEGADLLEAFDVIGRRERRRRALKLIGIAGLGLSAAGLATYPPRPLLHALADHVTGAGEKQTIALPQGGSIVLNTKTALNMRRGSNAIGAYELIDGEVLVETGAGNSSQTLDITTRHGVFIPSGTRFILRVLGELTRLSVLEGVVAIRPFDIAVHPGRTVAVSTTGVNDDVTTLAMDPAAWLEERLIVRDMPLLAFMTELWRYRSGWLYVDADIAKLKVSGVYQLDDLAAATTVLQRTLPIRIETYAGYLTHVTRRA